MLEIYGTILAILSTLLGLVSCGANVRHVIINHTHMRLYHAAVAFVSFYTSVIYGLSLYYNWSFGDVGPWIRPAFLVVLGVLSVLPAVVKK